MYKIKKILNRVFGPKCSDFQVGFGSSDSDILSHKYLNLTRYLENFSSGMDRFLSHQDRFLSHPDQSLSTIKMHVIFESILSSSDRRLRVFNIRKYLKYSKSNKILLKFVIVI